MIIEPIGYMHCAEKYSYDVARQGQIANGNLGTIELNTGQNFEQALQDLQGFSHIWLIFQFHENKNWKPLIKPPRGVRKIGLFASRAPYRPNSLGISCVELQSIKGRTITVRNHDLLDNTPIFDIKPYITYADSFPDATCGWLDKLQENEWQIKFAEFAEQQLQWLEENELHCLRPFLEQQLRDNPLDQQRKRLQNIDANHWQIAYRTWRAEFAIDKQQHNLIITKIYSGYSSTELLDEKDPYSDKKLHHKYINKFGRKNEK